MSGRIRSIKPDWLEDERMVLASSDARTLSISLLLLADDYGNGRAATPLLLGRVFPGKPLETLVSALEELSGWFVQLYERDGQRYFHIRNWKKHQKVDHPGKPQVPPPPESLAKVPEGLAPDWKGEEGKGGERIARAPAADESRESHEPEPEEPRPTICPLDLMQTADKAGITSDFVEKYSVEPEQIRDATNEFVSYWTIGGGMGRKHANWPKKLREHLRRACEKPGGLKALGELQHESRAGPSPELRKHRQTADLLREIGAIAK